MAGPLFGGEDECMHVFRNNSDFPYPPPYIRLPETAGLYLQSSRPPAGTAERVFAGDTLPLETPRLCWGRGVRWDNTYHRIVFTRAGLYEVRWIIPVAIESGHTAVVELVDAYDTILGRSACRSGLLSGVCVAQVRSGSVLRLINASSAPLNITCYGTDPDAVAGTLTVCRLT